MNEVLDRLMLARGRIEKGWCRNRRVNHVTKEYCLLGSLEGKYNERDAVCITLIDILGSLVPPTGGLAVEKREEKNFYNIMFWNDCLVKDKQEVLGVLDKAVAGVVGEVNA